MSFLKTCWLRKAIFVETKDLIKIGKDPQANSNQQLRRASTMAMLWKLFALVEQIPF
jgi:hypothetical protein